MQFRWGRMGYFASFIIPIFEHAGDTAPPERWLNHLKQGERAWGEGIAPSIDMASVMIDSIAKQFGISQNCISLSIVMGDFTDGTFH